MSTIEVKNTAGEKVADLELSDAVYGIEPNVPVMHQCVRYLMAKDRRGTHSTKNRSAVRGGGKKPWRQKGTGRARQGSIRATQWVGGGVPFGPTPRTHNKRTNNKEAKLAMRSALSAKLADGELVVVDEMAFDKPCTRQAKALLAALGVADKRVTVVLPNDAVEAFLSFRNLPKVRVIGVREANTHNLVDNAALVMPEAVVTTLEEALV